MDIKEGRAGGMVGVCYMIMGGALGKVAFSYPGRKLRVGSLAQPAREDPILAYILGSKGSLLAPAAWF